MPSRFSVYGVCLLVLLCGCAITEPAAPLSDLQNDSAVAEKTIEELVLDELNLVRTNPAGYADLVELRLDTFDGTEGKRAILECIDVLRRTSPVPPLAHSDRVARAARDHALDQGFSGRIGHDGSDGSDPFSRIDRYVVTNGAAENIQYGRYGARDIVMELLIDDGVPDRGHRINILDPHFKLVGIATGPHGRYKHMCVMDFTYEYQPW